MLLSVTHYLFNVATRDLKLQAWFTLHFYWTALMCGAFLTLLLAGNHSPLSAKPSHTLIMLPPSRVIFLRKMLSCFFRSFCQVRDK